MTKYDIFCVFVENLQRISYLCDTMKTLYLFNPENDMALAYGGPYYMPPANARRMASDLSALPVWYAIPNAEVWMARERDVQWLQQTCPLHLPIQGITVPKHIYNKVVPWGWSASIVHRLVQQDIDPYLCPSSQQLEQIRNLSARRTAVEVLRKIQLPHTLGEALPIHSLEEVDFPYPYLLKAPWSGSGRGIQRLEKKPDAPLQGWIDHILKTQGYLVAEPYYRKVVDFAMEFCMNEGVAEFMGYSLFETDIRGIYKENLLATDNEIEHRLSGYVPIEVLHAVCNQLLHLLPDAIGTNYSGCLGVDMMICQEDETYAVHPCVEINLRMNMGLVSRLFYDSYVIKGTIGRYVIEFYSKPGEALCAHYELQQRYPLVVEDNKIRQGYMSLTPVFEDTAYQAYVVID